MIINKMLAAGLSLVYMVRNSKCHNVYNSL